MKNTGLSASSKKIILFLVLAQFFCFKNFSLDFSSNDENPYMEKKNTEKQFLFSVQSTDKSFKTYPTTEEIILNAHKENRKSVALVLSGGGAKGFGQTGLLKELERAGIPVDMVIGSSAGALIGGFYAAGYRPEEIEEIALEMDWPELFSDESRNLYETYSKTTRNDRYFLDLGVSRNFKMEIGSSILSGQRILNLFKEKTVKIPCLESFNQLPVPYRAVALDIITGEPILLDKGDLSEAMRASMNLPAVFSPFTIGDTTYIDGGIIEHLPVQLARNMGFEIIISIDTGDPLVNQLAVFESNPMVSLTQMLNITQNRKNKLEKSLSDYNFTPPLDQYNMTSFLDTREIIRIGNEAAGKERENLADLKKKIFNGSVPGGQNNSTSLPETEISGNTVNGGAGVPEKPDYKNLPYYKLETVEITGCLDSDNNFIKREIQKILGKPFTEEAAGKLLEALFARGNYKKITAKIEYADNRINPQREDNPDIPFEPGRESRARPAPSLLFIAGDFEKSGGRENSFNNTETARPETENTTPGILHIEMVPEGKRGHSLRFGINYNTTLGMESEGKILIHNNFIMRDITNTGSALSAKISLLDNFVGEINFFQPIYDLIFLELDGKYKNSFDIFYQQKDFPILLASQSQTVETELKGGFFINSNTWIYGTAGYQWLEAPEFKDSRQLQINHILKAKTGLCTNNLNREVFPTWGWFNSFEMEAGFPVTNNKNTGYWTKDKTFIKLTEKGKFILPIGEKFRFIFDIFWGTEIREILNTLSPVSSFLGYSLGDREFFPHIVNKTYFANHKGAFKISASTNPLSPITPLGGEGFFTAGFAVGNVWDSYRDFFTEPEIEMAGTLGLGVLINEAFSLNFRIGAGSSKKEIMPFLAIDIGAI